MTGVGRSPARTRKRGVSGKHAATDTGLVARDAEMLAMRGTGATYSMIAKKFGVSDKAAWTGVHRALKRWPDAQDNADHVRQTEGARLRDVIAKALDLYDNPGPAYGSSGKPVTVEGVVQINRQIQLRALTTITTASKSLAILYGANMPVKVEVRSTPDIDGEIEMLAAAIVYGKPLPRKTVAGELEPGPDAGQGQGEP